MSSNRREFLTTAAAVTGLGTPPWPDDMPVPMLRNRMVCPRCGIVGADRPAPSASVRRIDSLRLGSRQARAVRHALRKAGSNPRG
jgi:hypothetical protein